MAEERKQLRAARALSTLRPIEIATTFLGAHALPPEAEGDKDSYIDRVCRMMIPAVAREGLELAPCDGVLAYNAGLAAARLRRDDEALAHLDLIPREHVHATFFQIGEQVGIFGQAVDRRMLADGDMIGDHTWSHANVAGDGPFAMKGSAALL